MANSKKKQVKNNDAQIKTLRHNDKWNKTGMWSIAVIGLISIVLILVKWSALINPPAPKNFAVQPPQNNYSTSGNADLDKLPGQTDGTAWLSLSDSKKHDVVKRALSNWKLTGVNVARNEDWFVLVLDGFYKDKHTDTAKVKVSEAMSVLGVGGNAFQ